MARGGPVLRRRRIERNSGGADERQGVAVRSGYTVQREVSLRRRRDAVLDAVVPGRGYQRDGAQGRPGRAVRGARDGAAVGVGGR